jgi:hypothetical protein
MKVAIPYCARLMDDNRLRVTRQGGAHIYLKLKVRKLQSRYPGLRGLLKRVIQAWHKNRNNRIYWYLHNILDEIVELAERKKLLIVLENLKNVKTGVNERGLRVNEVTGELQLHRKLPRGILGRWNRLMFHWIMLTLEAPAPRV